jgi:ubiquinol-cytochrome c reductase cytochrome b subunit
VIFYGVLWAESANDLIADKFSIPLYTLTWIARVTVAAEPVIAFFITRRICLGLQRKDRELLEFGLETGIVRQLPHGEFIEGHRPLTEAERAPLEAKRVPTPRPGTHDDNGVSAARARGLTGRARAIANNAFAETIPSQPNGHEPGQDADEAGPPTTSPSSLREPD